MLYRDDTWKWLEQYLTSDLEATTNKLYNSQTPLEEPRKLQGRIELTRTLLNSPRAHEAVALTRGK